jgi:hypothetical protein
VQLASALLTAEASARAVAFERRTVSRTSRNLDSSLLFSMHAADVAAKNGPEFRVLEARLTA